MKGDLMRARGLFNSPVLCVLALVLLAALSGCSARYDISLVKGAQADIAFSLTVDKAVMENMAQKAAGFSNDGSAPVTPEMKVETIKEALSGRKDVKVISIEKVSDTAVKGRLSVPDLAALGGTPETAFFGYTEAAGTATLSFHLDRKNASKLPELMVGLDKTFIEILAPPALYGDELTEDEYKQALLPFIGKRDMPAFEAAKADFRITPPGKINASSGGKVEGNTFIVTVSAMKAMVLDKPIEFSLSWRVNP
jgi:hypothetical protein